MADNYLENKMEEYRRGGQRRVSLPSPSRQRPGTAVLPFEPCFAAIYTAGKLPEALEQTAIALRATGSRVALVCPDTSYARPFAQAHSLVHVPASMLLASMDTPDISVYAPTDGLVVTASIFGCEYSLPLCPDLADRIIYLALPLTRSLD